MKGTTTGVTADRYINWSLSSSKKMNPLITSFLVNDYDDQNPAFYTEHPQYFVHIHKAPKNANNEKLPVYLTGRIKYSFPLCENPVNFNHLNATLILYKDMFLNGRTQDSYLAVEVVDYVKAHPLSIIENYSVDLSCTSATHIIMPFTRLEVGSYDGIIVLFNWYWSGPHPAYVISQNSGLLVWKGPTQFTLSNHYSLLADLQLQ